MDNEIKTKVCSKCHRELPLEVFNEDGRSRDGHFHMCKECKSIYSKESRKKKQGNSLHKVFGNPDLAKFTPRQLIEELRIRGYSGELKFTQIVKI